MTLELLDRYHAGRARHGLSKLMTKTEDVKRLASVLDSISFVVLITVS